MNFGKFELYSLVLFLLLDFILDYLHDLPGNVYPSNKNDGLAK